MLLHSFPFLLAVRLPCHMMASSSESSFDAAGVTFQGCSPTPTAFLQTLPILRFCHPPFHSLG
jgi:hypothetical protein